MNKKKKITIIIVVIVLLLLIGAVVFAAMELSNYLDLVYSEVYLEAGEESPDVSEFLKHDAKNVCFEEDKHYSEMTVGDYNFTIVWSLPVLGDRAYNTVLHVVDTTSPEIIAKSDELFLYTVSEAATVWDVIEGVNDKSDVEVAFAEDYDFSQVGEFDVTVVARDASGNESRLTVPCTIVKDTKAPVITGVEPLEVAMGDSIAYKKGVTVTDDYDKEPTLEVDTSQVNLDKRGFYPIIYKATDAAGNTSTAETTIQVKSVKLAEATHDVVYAMAEKIVNEITTAEMTDLEKARAIFDWVVDNITYSESAGIDDVLSAAYKGMKYRVGDCTVKQRTAEVMLNVVGIKNMEIEKIRDTRGHNWLLIDIGEGWYHYDPNLQLDGTLIFYWHDADLWEYSNAHKNTHNYDPSKYPTIQ